MLIVLPVWYQIIFDLIIFDTTHFWCSHFWPDTFLTQPFLMRHIFDPAHFWPCSCLIRSIFDLDNFSDYLLRWGPQIAPVWSKSGWFKNELGQKWSCQKWVGSKMWYKVWLKKKFPCVCRYYVNSFSFCEISLKTVKSRHSELSEMVRQAHVVQKIHPGSMIEQKIFFCKNTIFVKNYLHKKGSLAFVSFM